MFSAEPMPGHGVLEIPLPATMSCIDHMLGGPGAPTQPMRPLTEIESGVVARLRRAAARRDALLPRRHRRAATRRVTGIEYSPQFAQVAGAADVMVVATFDLRINERSYRMTICLPFSGLLPHLLKAAAPAPVSDRERAQRAQAADLRPGAVRRRCPSRSPVRFRTTRVDPDTPRRPRRRRRAPARPPGLRPARRHRRRQDLRPRHRRRAGPPRSPP